jgi:hypothetical protein
MVVIVIGSYAQIAVPGSQYFTVLMFCSCVATVTDYLMQARVKAILIECLGKLEG